jgi:hypothetical protein
MKIAVELLDEQAQLLTTTADRLGVRPEALARASLVDALGQGREDFHAAAEYVLQKNRVLYQRLV